jgi:SAM-dependent methyltransferase
MLSQPGTAESRPLIRSFRDPAGSVILDRGRVLRTVRPDYAGGLEAFLATPSARAAMQAGSLARTVRISSADAPGLTLDSSALDSGVLYEHERIPFASYPQEWPAEMLAEAASLTLELLSAAIPEGFGLKDATPYNVLFRGPHPVFVDVLSFEPRDPRDATWMAYAQFVRTFLLPLLAHAQFGFPPGAIFANQRDGLEPETLYRWAGWHARLTPPFLGLVTLPHWMRAQADAESYQARRAPSPEQARFILDHLMASCGRQLGKLTPRRISPKSASPSTSPSTWSGYTEHKSLYTREQQSAKDAFVREALQYAQPRTALDVGANEGRFSFMAARSGASVVAIDSDPAVVGTLWREARLQNHDVLPLVVDLTRPTPAMGWRNQECASFLERARGRFDMVMMLAVVHHMLVTERVPLDDILALAAELTRDFALIEFVAPEDPMFARIVRGRGALYSHLTFESFEAAAAAHFTLVKSFRIDGLHRCLYLFQRRRAHN